MARMISADAFIERFKKAKVLCTVFSSEIREVLLGMYDEFIEEIENQPTVDAVEVVRCEECMRYDEDCEFCKFWDGVRHPEHFCGEGVRKDDE